MTIPLNKTLIITNRFISLLTRNWNPVIVGNLLTLVNFFCLQAESQFKLLRDALELRFICQSLRVERGCVLELPDIVRVRWAIGHAKKNRMKEFSRVTL